MSDLPAFDEVHVLSDLHLGGVAGAQILRETGRLAQFVRRLARLRPEGTLALVLNGDVFDTLTEDLPERAGEDDVRNTVSRIVDDAAFAPIWQALAAFALTPRRTLVLVIGNHDLELALPPVQRLLRERLCGSDAEAPAHGRLLLSTAGAGFACRVGGARVFCIHGNEVDAWNFNRYEALARMSRRLAAGLPLHRDDWQPNAGTRLVREVMNPIKRRYAWIDLLKPETAAALGTLLVLDPWQAARIVALPGIVDERRRGTAAVRARLSDGPREEVVDSPARGRPWQSLLGPHLVAALGGAPPDVDEMLLIAERHLSAPPPSSDDAGATLGTAGLLRDRLGGLDTADALRRALLDWLGSDRSFDLDERDASVERLLASVGPAVDFIVTGHTHLARAIDCGAGRFFFNSGTWIRLLRLTPAMLADAVAFAPVRAVLVDGSLAALDAARIGGEPFVLDRTTAVAIRAEEDAVVGELLQVHGDGSGEPRVLRRHAKAVTP